MAFCYEEVMNMRKTIIFLALVAATFTTWSHVKITQMRIRVLYDIQYPGGGHVTQGRNPAYELPAEWVYVHIRATAKIPLSQREKPRLREENKWHKTLEWWFYADTPDGWFTLPDLSDVPIDKFEIEIIPPATRCARCDCAFDDLMPSPGLYLCTLDDKSFPKFAALPEKERILRATLASSDHQLGGGPFPIYYSYAETSFELQQFELNLHYWPQLRNTMMDGVAARMDPQHKDEYFMKIRSCLSFIHQSLEGKPKPDSRSWNESLQIKPRPDWDSSNEWKPMTDEEKKDIKVRLSSIICKDLKEKKEAWKLPVMIIPKEVVSEPLFSEVHCDDLEWQEGKFEN